MSGVQGAPRLRIRLHPFRRDTRGYGSKLRSASFGRKLRRAHTSFSKNFSRSLDKGDSRRLRLRGAVTRKRFPRQQSCLRGPPKRPVIRQSAPAAFFQPYFSFRFPLPPPPPTPPLPPSPP